MVKISVSGVEHTLDAEVEKQMEYFKEAEAIDQQATNKTIEFNTITNQTFVELLMLFKVANNKFPEFAKVKTSDAKEVIGAELADALSHKSYQQLNKLFVACQQFKVAPLKRVIASYVATKVYIKPTLTAYQQKKKDLGIEGELTAELSKKMKATYPFMN